MARSHAVQLFFHISLKELVVLVSGKERLQLVCTTVCSLDVPSYLPRFFSVPAASE